MPDFAAAMAKIQHQCATRGARSIRGLSRVFNQLDSYDGNKKVDLEEFFIGMNEFGCDLSREECAMIFSRWDEDGSGSLNFDEFLKGVRNEMSPARQAVVDAAFAKMDSNGSGEISMADLKRVYSASNHPKVISGEMTEDDVFMEFLQAFGDSNCDGTVTKEEWNDYYRGISSSVDTDAEFVLIINNAWKL